MIYRINYDEISAFKNYDDTINKIFSKVFDIKNKLKKDNFIVVTFDKDVKFVNPLFFILLFDLHCEYNFTLVIDIHYMGEKNQHYIHRLLTQYSDLDYFITYSKHSKEEYNRDIYNATKESVENDKDKNEQFRILLRKNSKFIHFFTSVVHRKSLIKDTENDYSMLPILKLRNFELKEINTYIDERALKPYEQRISFYNQLSLEQAKSDMNRYRKNLYAKIEELLIAVGLEKRGLSSSFRDIFFELIDNIRKHTPKQSNAHISFRKDKVSNLYELIISDNSCKGFLNTYKETLGKEKERLIKSGVNEKLLKNYDDVIDDIDNNKYEKVLKGLFELQKNKSDSLDNQTHIHQIPRIAMHFGLPVLIKLLEKLSKNSKATKPKLKLYLHNGNHYFEIVYSFKDGKYKIEINPISSYEKKGTYIIVTFPTDVEMLNDNQNSNLVSINLQNSDYKLFIEKKDKIEKKISNFGFYLDKQIANVLDNSKENYKCEKKHIFIKYTKHDTTFGEFLRNIYLYAYKCDIEDIVVTNIPLYEDKNSSGENIEHIKLLETIIYGDKNIQYEKSLNILFYSDRYPEAILIGGRNKEEYLSLNQFLPTWGKSSDNGISKTKKLNDVLDSKLFIEFDKKDYIIPFELFEIYDENRRNNSDAGIDTVSILRDMLETYLNEVAKKDDVHIDTGVGYHIDRFMEFKKVFEDSRWVKRLAFKLATYFVDVKNTKYYLIGTDKYTNMLISLCYTFLGLEDFKNFKYKLFNIYGNQDYKAIEEKIKNKKEIYKIYLISSVIVNAHRVEKLTEDYNIKAIPAISLNIEEKVFKNISPLFKIQNDGKTEKITDEKYCTFCDVDRKIPLLELTKDDPFFIKNTFFEPQPEKKIKSFGDKKNIYVKWFDSLCFGHTQRENNHFLYYINTIKFFNQNREQIEKFLSDEKEKIYCNKNEKIVLLTSSHDTNNNFVALVNQQVFDNEAIVLSFNKSRGEANFHDLKSYESFDWKNTKIFFVDDSIASSHTLKYFYQLLRSIPNIPNIGFDGVIIMIDRISSYDEVILCNYLKDSDAILNKKMRQFYVFSTFNIKPIKTEVEECFLCARGDRYNELAKKSVLDLTTFQMARRAYKLKEIKYRKIKSTKEKSLKDKFKVYLKAMATNYIYQKYAHKNSDSFGEFNTLLETFSKEMYDNIIEEKKELFENCDENILKEIIKFQSEIALLKALSFPKLSYYYDIRRWAISTILTKLKNEVKSIESEEFKLIYKFKKDIENQKTTSNPFLDFYKNMTNLHLINTYFATLGYFEDSKLLDTDFIHLYHKIVQNQKVRDTKNNSLLHTYPFAVKFTIADNLEKAKYFENNLNIVSNSIGYKNNEKKKKYALFNALKIENTLYWENYIRKKEIYDLKNSTNSESLESRINEIKKFFKPIFKTLKIHMFISPDITITPKDYQSYLDKSEHNLVNILDSFKNINSYPETMGEIVQKIFYGAVDIEKDYNNNAILEKLGSEKFFDKIDDTWANDYTDKYIVIRLTSIDTELLLSQDKDIRKNNPVWFKPIGCMVIEKDNIDYRFYMQTIRTVLSLKKYLIEYIEKEFSYRVIQEAIAKNMKYEIYSNTLTKISHSLYEHIDIGAKIRVFLEKSHNLSEYESYLKGMKSYSWGLMLLTQLHKLDKIESKKTNVNEIFYSTRRTKKNKTEYQDELHSFIKICGDYSEKLCQQCKYEKEVLKIDDKTECIIDIDKKSLKIIIFELIFNALKRMKLESNPKIKIKLESDKFIVSNKLINQVDPNDGKKYVTKFNNTKQKGENNRMGIGTIKEALLKCNYKINAVYNIFEKMFEVTLSIKETKWK